MVKAKDNNFNDTKIDFYGNISTYMDSYRAHEDIRAERCRRENENTDRSMSNPQHRTILDLQTFSPLKHQIPIGLMAVPNDVTGRNPLDPIQHIEMPEDERKEEVMKTRPRIFKSPQISLDDVPYPDMRKMLLDYTYTTESEKTNHDLWNLIGIEVREVPETVVEHDKFLTTSNKHYFAVYFKPQSLLQVKMSPEQNLRGRHWEKDKIVGISDSTEHFWKQNKPKYGPSYNHVLNLVEKNTRDEISQLVANDKLEVQHDKTSPGYAGYKSNVAVGVDLRKKDVPHNHPLLSIYQETFSWKTDPTNSKSIS